MDVALPTVSCTTNETHSCSSGHSATIFAVLLQLLTCFRIVLLSRLVDALCAANNLNYKVLLASLHHAYDTTHAYINT